MPIDIFEGIKQAEQGILDIGMDLANGKWRELIYLEGDEIESDYKTALTAIMLENTARELASMEETTKAASIATFQKYAFPIIRAIMPQMVAMDLVSVQPMQGPVGMVFYLDFIYGKTKGNIAAGQKMFVPSGYGGTGTGVIDGNYSSEVVFEEDVYTPNASLTTFDFVLQYTPVIPGTVSITWEKATNTLVTATDDGNGGFTVSPTETITGSTINYTTGAVHLVLTNAPEAAPHMMATYNYDMETNTNIPEIDIVLNSSTISAQDRKLRARWSLKAEQDAKALHGIAIDSEMATALATQVQYELDSFIVKQLLNNSKDITQAPYSLAAWDIQNFEKLDTGISWTEYKWQFIDWLNRAAKLMFKQSGRATPTFMVCGATVAAVFEALQPRFKPVDYQIVQGVHKIGNLDGKWDIYEDFNMPDLQLLMGHKGDNILQAGYIWAPYVPLIMADVMLDDFVKRKGLMRRDGTKALRSDFYLRCTLANTNPS